jgi:hypothetical protein
MIKINKTLRNDLLKYLGYNLDLRNPQTKNFINNENGLEKLQNELLSNREYRKKYNLRRAQKKFQDKKREQKKEINIKRNIKNFIKDEYNSMLELTKPDGIYEYNQLEFGEENRIYLFKEIIKTIQNVINYDNNLMTDINLDGTYYTLHKKTIDTFIEKMKGETISAHINSSLIDVCYSVINGNIPIIFKTTLKSFKNEKKEGAFFPYYNKTNLNLLRYQITNGEHGEEDNINKDNCLIYALRLLGVEEYKLLNIKNYVNNGKIPMCKINNICEEAGIRINLTTERNDKNNRETLYGKEGIIYNIAYFEEHYFINEKTNYTKYYIENYEELENKPNINDKNYIYYYSIKKGYSRDKERVIKSIDLIKLMLENPKMLEKIDYSNINLYDEPFKGYVMDEDETNFKDLYYEPKYNAILYEEEEEDKEEDKKDKKKLPIIVFDFETYEENNIHIPYLCCIIDKDDNEKKFIGRDCGEQLLKSLKEDCILMAHNAKYDMRFLIKYLSKCSEIVNGSSFITFSGYYGKIKIIIKDSYKLISSKLCDMPKMFLNKEECLKIKKEVMPYGVYNQMNLLKKYIELDECLKHIKNEEDKKEFINNCKEWDLIYKNKVDILEYSVIYCFMDCKILKKCYNVFREWCLNDFKMDINEILTIPTLAEKYFKNCGCFDGCYKLSGLPQLFISRAIVGGRTMMKDNKKNKIEDQILNDFDAVSLYPSAMSRINGFLKGVPKVIKNLDYNIIKNYDGYFIQIKILKVGIKRGFPLMSYKTNDVKDERKRGIRNFSNDMEGKIIIVDKITTEDLIKFQEVEFEVLRGYYFDEGFNNKIVETINYLFSKRAELKKKTKEHPEGNKAEIIYKLIMNAGYGKLITKPHETKIKFFDKEKEFKIYKSRNYNIINNYIEYTNGKYRIEINDMKGNQYNYCHLGSEILSMSKRIMNEVICTAEDNNLKIHYQDTDSIHINDEDIKKLSNIFKDKYNRDLIGKKMGQFHSDFKMEVEGVDIKNIVSTGLIMLGKKSYIDKLRGEDKDGNYYYDYHIRLKGINQAAINHLLKKDYNNNPYKLYEDLYEGKKIMFDLTAEGDKCCFEFNKSYEILNKQTFKREVCF